MIGMKRWLLVLVSLLAIACSPLPQAQAPLPSPSLSETPSAAVAAIKTYLTQQTGLPADQFTLQRVEAATWADACLDLPQPNELCAQVVTPGLRVELATPQRQYVVHSDRAGRLMRLAPGG